LSKRTPKSNKPFLQGPDELNDSRPPRKRIIELKPLQKGTDKLRLQKERQRGNAQKKEKGRCEKRMSGSEKKIAIPKKWFPCLRLEKKFRQRGKI